MLRLSETIINQPIMSLRTGTQVATSIAPIINPNNLKIEGLYCLDSLNKKLQLVLLYQDIRDIAPQGIVINDHEVLSEASELHRLKEIIRINFNIFGKQVSTVSKTNLGKVNDYAVEPKTMYIQKLYVSAPIIRNFTGGILTIDRSQIVEITSKKIIVNDLEQTVPARAVAAA